MLPCLSKAPSYSALVRPRQQAAATASLLSPTFVSGGLVLWRVVDVAIVAGETSPSLPRFQTAEVYLMRTVRKTNLTV